MCLARHSQTSFVGLNRTPELGKDRACGLAAHDKCLPPPAVFVPLTHELTLKEPTRKSKRGEEFSENKYVYLTLCLLFHFEDYVYRILCLLAHI